jgi:hypothetical protein
VSRRGVRRRDDAGWGSARAVTGGKRRTGRRSTRFRATTFGWRPFARKKVTSRAPFATNVLSSGLPSDGAVPGRTLDESFTSSTRAASLEGSVTAVATVRAPSECRFARPDEKRAGVLIPDSARARPRGSPRLCARTREKAAAGARTPYVSVEVIVWRWGRALRSAKVQRATDRNQSASLGNYPSFEAAKRALARFFATTRDARQSRMRS